MATVDLIIVARDEPELYEDLKAKFAPQDVEVIADRRSDRTAFYPRDRRTQHVEPLLQVFGFAFVEPATPSDAPTSPSR